MIQHFTFHCWIIFHCMTLPHFIYPFISLLGLLVIMSYHQLLGFITFCLLQIMLQWTFIYVCTFVLISLEYIPRSTIVRTHGNSILHILRNCQIVFQSSCAIYNSTSNVMRVLISPYICQHLLCLSFSFSYSGGSKIVSHSFELHFSNY